MYDYYTVRDTNRCPWNGIMAWGVPWTGTRDEPDGSGTMTLVLDA